MPCGNNCNNKNVKAAGREEGRPTLKVASSNKQQAASSKSNIENRIQQTSLGMQTKQAAACRQLVGYAGLTTTTTTTAKTTATGLGLEFHR